MIWHVIDGKLSEVLGMKLGNGTQCRHCHTVDCSARSMQETALRLMRQSIVHNLCSCMQRRTQWEFVCAFEAVSHNSALDLADNRTDQQSKESRLTLKLVQPWHSLGQILIIKLLMLMEQNHRNITECFEEVARCPLALDGHCSEGVVLPCHFSISHYAPSYGQWLPEKSESSQRWSSFLATCCGSPKDETIPLRSADACDVPECGRLD